MARTRNSIAQFVSFDMTAMATHIQGMTDAQLGAWCRKMVIDCCSGCIAPDADPFVRHYYNRSHSKMAETQKHNSRMYQNRRNAEIYDQETAPSNYHNPDQISTNDQAGNLLTRESETRGTQTDNNLAESATRTSEAVKALADGDIREDSLNMHDGSNAARMESGTSAKTLGEARESRRTGGTPKRVEKPTASHAETLPVRSPDLFGEGEKKPYGTCKNVLLSDADGHHLREVYGQDLATAIEILDSALENNPKLKKRYKNHAAVLRYGNWVWQEVQKIKERQVRLETAEINKKAAEKRAANGDGRTFKQKDSDDRNEWLRTSMFTNEAANG
ncbi:MAG: hypothetical protein IJ982_01135 [Fibrobacter sp.]|nr:hypothetical protein [Fibrobacter sp.]